MESGMNRTQKAYTLAFKLVVVEQVEKGELTRLIANGFIFSKCGVFRKPGAIQ